MNYALCIKKIFRLLSFVFRLFLPLPKIKIYYETYSNG